MQFFGHGSEHLSAYADEQEIQNVEFIGGFAAEETFTLLDRIDVINNLYGRGSLALDTAVSIKYYYSVLLRIPIVVFSNTYMQTVTEGIGLAIGDDFTNLPDILHRWYHDLDFAGFELTCAQKSEQIQRDNADFYERLTQALQDSDDPKAGNR